jgi:hypothetical protein
VLDPVFVEPRDLSLAQQEAVKCNEESHARVMATTPSWPGRISAPNKQSSRNSPNLSRMAAMTRSGAPKEAQAVQGIQGTLKSSLRTRTGAPWEAQGVAGM